MSTPGTGTGPIPPDLNSPQWRTVAGTLFDGDDFPVAIVDENGKTVYCNPRMTQAFGVAAGTLLRESLPELVGVVFRTFANGAEVRTLIRTAESTSYLAVVTPIVPQDRVRGALCVLSEPDVVGADGTITDSLRERDAIIDSSDSGLWICDGDGVVLRMNPASEELNGIRETDAIGRNVRELVEQGVFDRSAVLEVLEKQEEVHVLQRTRSGRQLLATAIPVFDDSGGVRRVVSTERDVTVLAEIHDRLEIQKAIQNRIRDDLIEFHALQRLQEEFIARSPSMIKVLAQALKVSKVDATTLLLGESGVGKGAIAELIHKHSPRSDQPIIHVNCGAIPANLIEAELFGYQKGAFTGAHGAGRAGYIESAAGGTLFLDEIGELQLSSQVKLLRFLEDGRITRLGETSARDVDARIIAATNRDLRGMVEQGRFREDLYYRLNVIPIRIPPLRERRECVLALIGHFVRQFSDQLGLERRMSHAALDSLLVYPYPGNVRELMNICRRLVALSDQEIIGREDLPPEVLQVSETAHISLPPSDEGKTLPEILEAVEKAALRSARERFGSHGKMAAALGVDRTTIARKLQKYGIP